MKVDTSLCTGCGHCMQDCPNEAVRVIKKKAVVDATRCSHCGVCFRVCPDGAMARAAEQPSATVECDHCPIKCWVPPGALGACQRYVNEAGVLLRTMPAHTFAEVRDIVGDEPSPAIREPLITAIGAGTTYPCCKPAPRIVRGTRDEVDVVTVVTEVPLSYSSILVKVDTDVHIGGEGAGILVGKRLVGMVETEQYGSKMLHIGGVNRLTGNHGFTVARTITDLANGKAVKVRIEGGSRLVLQVGHPPVIDGKKVAKMRVGCGSATLGIFAPMLSRVADDVVVLDSHVTGLMSRHVAGNFAGVKPTGVSLKFKPSTPGRYFGDHGNGWGGTSITRPIDIVDAIDMQTAWPGMTILITETTGQEGAMFELQADGTLVEIPVTRAALEALEAIEDACEPSLVSAMYTAGSGGSARAGVTRYPIKLTRAVHRRQVSLTVGGAPAYVMPGGGISFLVDVERVKQGAFYWTPTPATICPLEYTMTVAEYEKMGGHVEAMKPFDVKAPEPAPESKD